MKTNIGKFLKNDRRKVDIKIESHDTWSMDTHLALIILPMLIQLKEGQKGIPATFGNVGGADYDLQQSFDFYAETYDQAFEKACENWNEVLEKMIWSFQELVHGDVEDKYHHGDMKTDWVKTDEQYYNPVTKKMEDIYTMVDTNPNEHWYDAVGHKLHEERIQEGLELFGKYFHNLWE